GPSHSLSGGIINEDWIMVNSGDGFVCRVDPNDSDLVYAESQDGNVMRRNLRTGEVASLRPRESQANLLAARTQPALAALAGLFNKPLLVSVTLRLGPQHRFNWNTPVILS